MITLWWLQTLITLTISILWWFTPSLLLWLCRLGSRRRLLSAIAEIKRKSKYYYFLFLSLFVKFNWKFFLQVCFRRLRLHLSKRSRKGFIIKQSTWYMQIIYRWSGAPTTAATSVFESGEDGSLVPGTTAKRCAATVYFCMYMYFLTKPCDC